jgi:hypothetical protein
MDYCCEVMRYNLEYVCELHPDPFYCPDNILYKQKRGVVGIIVHDGGSSIIGINYCPWCGTELEVRCDDGPADYYRSVNTD